MSLSEKMSSLSSEMRELANEITDIRKEYLEEVQKHNTTKRILNYIMREIKDIEVDSKFNLDLTLMIDAVMIDNESLNSDKLKIFYSVDSLDEGIKEFKGLNCYDELLKKVEDLRKKFA